MSPTAQVQPFEVWATPAATKAVTTAAKFCLDVMAATNTTTLPAALKCINAWRPVTKRRRTVNP